MFNKYKKRVKELEAELEQFRDIIDLNKEIADRLTTQKSIEGEISILKESVLSLKECVLDQEKIIAIYSQDLENYDYGIYEYSFNLDDSNAYKDSIKSNKEKQKELIKNKTAATCETEWTVDGSVSRGRAQTTQNIKLALRAFNAECDSFISKIKWNNIHSVKPRFKQTFDAINKLTSKNHVEISYPYLNLKIQEAFLVYEQALIKEKEKEEQLEIKRQIREEEKAQREVDRIVLQAKKEEALTLKALEEAKKNLGAAHESEVTDLQAKIDALETELRDKHNTTERAISQAQLTRRGHVYIISNIGSFGEDVFKIGLTRRLEPMDRVKELSSASVPFSFDVHAMIYSEDAPALEKLLHNSFSLHRVNKANSRKEFFNISIEGIENKVKELGLDMKLTRLAEAKEFRQSKSKHI